MTGREIFFWPGRESALQIIALTQQRFRAAIAQGHGEEDICPTIKVLEPITGVEVKSA